LTGGTASFNYLSANNIILSDIVCNTITGSSGSFEYLTGGTASFNYLSANNITLSNIVCNTITGSSGSFEYLTGGTASFNYLSANNITLSNIVCNTITGSSGSFEYLTGGTASFNYLIPANGTAMTFLTGSMVFNSAYPIISQNSDNNYLFNNSTTPTITNGTRNVGMGSYALSSLTSGTQNMAFGMYSCSKIQGGQDNVGVGYYTLGNATDNYNVAIGSAAGYNVTVGNRNTLIGYEAGYSMTGGYQNTYIGNDSGRDLGQGHQNTLIGSNTNFDSTSANYNNSTALGYGATITKSNQVVLGTSSETVTIPGNLGFVNTGSFGYVTGGTASFEYINGGTASFGYVTGGTASFEYLTGGTASFNYLTPANGNIMTFLTGSMLFNSAYPIITGNLDNTNNFIINNNLQPTITSGTSNTSIGIDSLKSITEGYGNVAFGKGSGIRITTGYNNFAMGTVALARVNTSNSNVALGSEAGSNINGNANTAVGSNAGQYAGAGGYNNTFIGYKADVVNSGSTTTITYHNSTAIGSDSKITASNQIVLGTSAETVTIPGWLTGGTAGFNYINGSTASFNYLSISENITSIPLAVGNPPVNTTNFNTFYNITTASTSLVGSTYTYTINYPSNEIYYLTLGSPFLDSSTINIDFPKASSSYVGCKFTIIVNGLGGTSIQLNLKTLTTGGLYDPIFARTDGGSTSIPQLGYSNYYLPQNNSPSAGTWTAFCESAATFLASATFVCLPSNYVSSPTNEWNAYGWFQV
jgi:hypothetical protein